MAAKILAILEQRDGLLKRSAFETVQQAAQLAKDLSLEAEAVIVGGDVENLNYPEHLNKFLNDSTMSLVAERIDSIFPDLDLQEKKLAGAGVIVMVSNTQAVKLASKIISKIKS